MTKRTLADFRALVDPFHPGDSPSIVFPWSPVKGAQRYIITAAQNATPVHPAWWAVLKAASAELGAPLRVIPYRYKNPSSSWKGSQENVGTWAAELDGLLVSERAQLNANLQLLADIKIQPTAADPVGYGDLHAISGACSAIVGHPKIQTRSIATPANRMSKLLMTSGVCTQANYSDTRAGRVGEFHHSLSAVLVELDGKRFYARRLHYDAKTRSATDSATGTRYMAKGSERAPRALALVLGDLHRDFADPAVIAATFGKGGLVETARPRHVVYHDVTDGHSINPHHRGDPFKAFEKRRNLTDDVQAECNRVAAFLRDHTRPDTQNVVVWSNHDDFVGRWVRSTDWRTDPTNARFYFAAATRMLDAPDSSPFADWLSQQGLPQTRVLNRDESFTLGGVELGMHGDRGPNGARGSIRNLRRVGVKSIIGHSHSPGEDEGATQVGTSTALRLDYNTGPSSWLNAHALLGDDGKRQLVVIVDGAYRL